MFDSVSSAYSYLLAGGRGGEALIIDPVLDRIVFYCAFGEHSAMAVQAAQDAGLSSACHIQGGVDAWKKAKGPIVR